MSRLQARATFSAVIALLAGCAGEADSPGPLQSTSRQDGIELIVTADRSVVRIAEPVTVNVEVTADESMNVSLPEPLADESAFVAVDVGTAESETADGHHTHRRTFTFESYTSGRRAIPAFVVKYGGTGESSIAQNGRTLRSEPILMRVVSSVGLFADPQKFRDNVSVVDPPHGWLFWTIASCVALAAIAGLAMTLISLGRRLALPSSPGETAVRELNAIERRRVREQWTADKTIAAVDAVLREFLQQFWRLPDAQLTAEELAWAAEAQRELGDGERAAIHWLLRTADQMKFAQSEVTSVEAAQTIAVIRGLIVAMMQPTTSRSQGILQETASHV